MPTPPAEYADALAELHDGGATVAPERLAGPRSGFPGERLARRMLRGARLVG